MWLDTLLKLVRKSKPPDIQMPPYNSSPIKLAESPFLSLPHTREADPVNEWATVANINLYAVMTDWFIRWKVPAASHDYFRAINITLDDKIQYPAYALGNKLIIQPKFANAGVLSHEMSHIIYAQLTPAQKHTFAIEYKALLSTDPLMILLDEKESYINTSDIEAHAEIYRFLGEKMPSTLQKYYPKFF